MLLKATQTFVIIQKSQLRWFLSLDQKVDPIRKKNRKQKISKIWLSHLPYLWKKLSQRTENQNDILWITVGFSHPFKSFYVNFGWWNFSLIILLIPAIYAFRCIFFYVNDRTNFSTIIKYQYRHSVFIKEIYEYLNFQAQQKTTPKLFLTVIWIVTQMYLFSARLGFLRHVCLFEFWEWANCSILNCLSAHI